MPLRHPVRQVNGSGPDRYLDSAVYVELMINTECSARAVLKRQARTLEGKDNG